MSIMMTGSIHRHITVTMPAEQAESMLQAARTAHSKGDLGRASAILADLIRSGQAGPEADYLLGSCYLASGYPAQAITHLQNAITSGPPQTHWLMDLLVAQRLHGTTSAAMHTCQELLQLASDSPLAHVYHASLLADTGKADAAAAAYRTAIGMDQDCAEAWLGLAQLGGRHAAGIDTDALKRLQSQTLPFSPKLTTAQMRQQSILNSCVARLLHVRRNYHSAYSHFAAANRYRKQLQHAHNRFDIKRQRRQFDQMRETCLAHTDIPANPQQNHDAVRPIFIVGMLRTGTTLLETLLCRHSEVIGGGEMMHIKHIAMDKLTRATGASYPQLLRQLTPGLARMAAQHYVSQATATAMRMNPHCDVNSVHYIVDKMPSNFEDLALIRKLFPDAIIVHTSRDPMDMLWSCYREELSASYCNDLDDLLDYYSLYLDYMRLWQQTGLDLYHLPYEQLVSDPRSALSELLQTIGLPQQDLISDQGRANLTNTASAQQVRSPIHDKSIGQWRCYAEQLGGLQVRLNAITDSQSAGNPE